MEKKSQEYNLTAQVNTINLSYNDVGTGSIPVIFLHGYPFDKTMWQAQVDFLKSSYRLITCDVRGFGKSTDEKSALSIDLFADDLVKLMDKLDIDKAIICGLSMGGFIALNALNRFPGRFEALILCDTQCIADTADVKAKRQQVIDEIEVHGAADFSEKFLKSVFHKNSLANKTEVVEQLRTVVFANSEHIISQGLLALAGRSETCSTLSAITIPTLIICGREDEVTPLEQSDFMHKNIKGSILQVIEHAGHVSNLEEPHIFNKHLFDFLTTLPGIRIKNLKGSQRSIA